MVLHYIKVALLLLAVLATMRAGSWMIGWLISLATRRTTVATAAAANALALSAFVGLLVWNLVPGEPFDYAATGFGAVVFTICFVFDRKWYPWKDRAVSVS